MSVSQITISSEGPTFSRLARGMGSSTRWELSSNEMLDMITACLDMGITMISSATKAESLELSREQWFRIWVASTGKRLP